MSEVEKDPVSGQLTTGHEWNGIKELDTPVPRGVLMFLVVTHVFAVLWWVLMPTWPLGWTYTRGILGQDMHQSTEQAVSSNEAQRAGWTKQIDTLSYDEIEGNDQLMSVVMDTGHRLFGDNCAACHGRNAKGNGNYPDLTDDDWLWGDGNPETIAETLRVGINSPHPETRFSQMPAFGRDQMLTSTEVRTVATYVYSLSHPESATPENADQIAAGHELFETNCAACHGESGTGDREMGVPNLTDNFWLYGGDLKTIITTIHGGRQGHMPTWDERLTPTDIKILALYVHALNVANP
jgi:cytochrome c oxidase cbb3-type subunit 3